MKHTPGEWEITRVIIDKVNGGAVFEIKGDSNIIWVADVRDKANAQLIAAAPDLLEVCKTMLAVSDLWEVPEPVDECYEGKYQSLQNLKNMIKEALSKVEAR